MSNMKNGTSPVLDIIHGANLVIEVSSLPPTLGQHCTGQKHMEDRQWWPAQGLLLDVYSSFDKYLLLILVWTFISNWQIIIVMDSNTKKVS